MGIQTIHDFYNEIYSKNRLAQRNAYQVYFGSPFGSTAAWDNFLTKLPFVQDITTYNGQTDTDPAVKEFNVLIESVEFPEAIKLETAESGSIWFKNHLPQDALDIGSELKITFFDVKDSPVDIAFHKWIKEVNKPVWSADGTPDSPQATDAPHPTAAIAIDFYGTQNGVMDKYASYYFFGVYPSAIDYPSTTVDGDSIVGKSRTVTFCFSCVKVINYTSQTSV